MKPVDKSSEIDDLYFFFILGNISSVLFSLPPFKKDRQNAPKGGGGVARLKLCCKLYS